ncbi:MULTISPECIES: Zn-ribbon domain-containing OB-fold protein [Bradyrhizobium]|uniref:DUF35 domain-containing protein n=2 Tax=Bradyrhizobium TaxID=374 RepID=A0ABY0PM29_9BRAD|nr:MULTISPECIES: hypothetical protein [Bradyrhizobium]SDI62851.1 hypothetical protein SAMN05444163_3299 [Bradyrhizobium ottawaense]SED34791.1 hypothetical protein SAMN05444171_3869 [Bradyrhizobium lablabi]SHL37018.1 hypothetical protein SAMN05444321_2679 [Bradyrhizobium lablabi]
MEYKYLKSGLYSDAAKDGVPGELVLHGGRCHCGYSFFPMQSYGCERCGRHGNDLKPSLLSTRGTLLARAVVHLHANTNRTAPFTIVKVALDDGPVVRALLAENEPEGEPGQRLLAKLFAVESSEAGENTFDLRFVAVDPI